MKQILLLSFLLLITACQNTNLFVEVNDGKISKQEPTQELSANKVLFVEHMIQEIGKIYPATNESYSKFTYIDGPAYFWDNEKKILTIEKNWSDFKYDERDKIIYGFGGVLDGDIGSGIGSVLVSSDNFPFQPETGVEIKKVDKYGTVYIGFEGKEIILSPNQKVQRVHYRLERDGLKVIAITETEWFFNSGFINPDQVIGPRKSK